MTDLLEEKRKVRINRSVLLTLIIGAFALGLFLGAGTRGLLTPVFVEKGEGLADRNEEFKFIRVSQEPISESEGHIPSRELKPFRYKVSALIQGIIEKGEVSAISFYFRDLINGNRFGIGENYQFSPENLLKLPLMIAYFKWAETNPLVLRRTLAYAGSEVQQEQRHSKPLMELEPGSRYTVNDLIFRMIAYDDSAAYTLLRSHIPLVRLDRIFKDLNVEYDPRRERENKSMSLSAFANLYRVLYNASYLNEEMSEKALRYLSKSTFRDAMASGIPSSIVIASKHGEQTISPESDDDQEVVYQLHEFGIVYHPNRPFIIGIVVRGTDFSELEKAIRDITRLVYEEVDQQS